MRVIDCNGAGTAERSYPASEVGGAAERRYPASNVGGAAERSYPASKVRVAGRRSQGRRLEGQHTCEAKGGGQKDQPHVQGAVVARVQEGLEELSHVEG